eukprot:GILJ01017861.1.p1 GENE.GILJ01017861.1~~GILJ01017861.1.p1  ORF type:complete len:433 (+),score=52.11 GILJ01017861.1:163-1299(+)
MERNASPKSIPDHAFSERSLNSSTTKDLPLPAQTIASPTKVVVEVEAAQDEAWRSELLSKSRRSQVNTDPYPEDLREKVTRDPPMPLVTYESDYAHNMPPKSVPTSNDRQPLIDTEAVRKFYALAERSRHGALMDETTASETYFRGIIESWRHKALLLMQSLHEERYQDLWRKALIAKTEVEHNPYDDVAPGYEAIINHVRDDIGKDSSAARQRAEADRRADDIRRIGEEEEERVQQLILGNYPSSANARQREASQCEYDEQGPKWLRGGMGRRSPHDAESPSHNDEDVHKDTHELAMELTFADQEKAAQVELDKSYVQRMLQKESEESERKARELERAWLEDDKLLAHVRPPQQQSTCQCFGASSGFHKKTCHLFIQ